MMKEKVLLDSKKIDEIIKNLSDKIYKDIADMEKFAIVGVQSGGVEIARRIKEKIEQYSGKQVRNGILDITFHRDDLATRGVLPVIKETRIEFDISNLTILLVDDVIFTGRTTKAALETLTTFGRPKAIKLLVLIDRGNRELPIQPDYCGFSLQTELADNINVILTDNGDDKDSVVLCTGN